MAYEMLTARLPYTGASLFDIGMKQVEGKVDMTGIAAGARRAAFAARLPTTRQRGLTSALAFADALAQEITNTK